MNFYEQLFCRGRTTGEGMTHFERLFAAKFGGSPPPEVREYTGAVPVTITADGTPLLDYLITGSTIQNGTPTPDSPIMPQGTGERTGNLSSTSTFNNTVTDTRSVFRCNLRLLKNNATIISKNIDISQTGLFYITATAEEATDDIDRIIVRHSGQTSNFGVLSVNVNISSGTAVTFSANALGINPTVVGGVSLDQIMLNTGAYTPYQPYGYKIPISSAGQTNNIYLGEVESTRRIKKMVLTGEENWTYEEAYSRFCINVADFTTLGLCLTPFISNAFGSISDGRPLADVPDNTIYSGTTGSVDNHKIFIKCTAYTSLNYWKAYLQQQYAAGTPVTVWYVLANETTGIVNEPLMKIGDYADTLSKAQAGVAIPTNNGSTTVDVDTTVKPSEVYIKYMG